VILDARKLDLVHILPFWDVFPGTLHSEEHLSCLSVDSGMKLVCSNLRSPLQSGEYCPQIVSSMNARIAVWSLSGVQDNLWHVHSSLVLPLDHRVTTLDCKSGNRPRRSIISAKLTRLRTARRWLRNWSLCLHVDIGE